MGALIFSQLAQNMSLSVLTWLAGGKFWMDAPIFDSDGVPDDWLDGGLEECLGPCLPTLSAAPPPSPLHRRCCRQPPPPPAAAAAAAAAAALLCVLSPLIRFADLSWQECNHHHHHHHHHQH